MIKWQEKFDAIYCISLADNISRRDDLKKELSRVGILNSNIFHWKITVKNELYKYIWNNPSLKANKWWFHLTGTLNCTLEHYAIYKECLALGYKRVLVLEDDIVFLKNIKEIQKAIDNIPENYDILKFNSYFSCKEEELQKVINSNKINDYYFDYSSLQQISAACYAVSPKAMLVLTKYQEAFYQPCDTIFNVQNPDIDGKLIRVSTIKDICIQNFAYTDDLKYEDGDANKNEEDYNVIKDIKYSIYTWMFGDEYNSLPKVFEKDPNAEYVIITDNKELYNKFQHDNIWNIIYEESLKTMDEYEKFLYYLCNPFKYCNNDIVIKLDSKILFEKHPTFLLQHYIYKHNNISFIANSKYNNINEYYKNLYNSENTDKNNIINELAKLKQLNVDLNAHLYKHDFIIQSKGKDNENLNNLVYAIGLYLKDFNIPVDILFSYIINKFFNNLQILILKEDILDSPYFKINQEIKIK